MPAKRPASRQKGSSKKRKIIVLEDPDESVALQVEGISSLISESRDNETATSELEDSTLVSDGEGFASQIFAILVGPQEQKFTAHASFLSQSPVLDRMCHGHFEESRTFTIRLPEDDPKVIKAMIQYLYTGDFTNYGLHDDTLGISAMRAGFQLVDLYKVAEKYQLQQLKTLILEKLGGIIDGSERPKQFLATATRMYTDLLDSDYACRAFFIVAAKGLQLPKLMSKALRQYLDECISSGANLAQDLFQAMVSKYEEFLSEEMKERREATSAAADLRATNQRLLASVKKLREERNRLEDSAALA
ncbi:MAG: hypothetical protein Q9182_005688 [Xanthomendoza sp. 2 TL-2023]